MSDDHEIDRQVVGLFDMLVHNQTIDDIKQLADRLPNNSSVRRKLAARCREQSLKEVRAGHHTEGRRLGILSRQLQDGM
jgi:hypothetical protein